MSDHRDRPEVEILSVTDTGRRRRWTDAQKVRIVEEIFGPRGSMAETARRHDIGRTLLVRCKRRFHPIEFMVAAGGFTVLTERNELAGESRTRSF
jgi:transposase-like protein